MAPSYTSNCCAMIVLCTFPRCGAVLRSASTQNALQVLLLRDADGWYFTCPRCGRRSAARPVDVEDGVIASSSEIALGDGGSSPRAATP